MHADPEPIGPKPSPRLVTPLLDRLTREVTRPKGSALAGTRGGRGWTVDPSRRRTGRPVILEVTGSNPGSAGTRTESSRRGGRRRARAGGHVRRTDSRGADAAFPGSSENLRLNSDDATTSSTTTRPTLDESAVVDENARTLASNFAPDVATFETARREADEATRAARRVLAATPVMAKTTKTTRSSDDHRARPPRPRWVAEYELDASRESRRRPRARRRSPTRPTTTRRPTRPLRCPSASNCANTSLGKAADRARASGTFCPSRLRPAPRRGAPRVVRVDAGRGRRGGDGEITRIGRRLRRLDGGRVDRRLRRSGDRADDGGASAQVARRRGDAQRHRRERRRRRRTSTRDGPSVAVAHAAAAGDVDATLAFDAAVRRGCEEALGDVPDSLRWWYGCDLRGGHSHPEHIFAAGAVGNTREREKGAHGGFGVHATHDAVRSVRGVASQRRGVSPRATHHRGGQYADASERKATKGF